MAFSRLKNKWKRKSKNANPGAPHTVPFASFSPGNKAKGIDAGRLHEGPLLQGSPLEHNQASLIDYAMTPGPLTGLEDPSGPDINHGDTNQIGPQLLEEVLRLAPEAPLWFRSSIEGLIWLVRGPMTFNRSAEEESHIQYPPHSNFGIDSAIKALTTNFKLACVHLNQAMTSNVKGICHLILSELKLHKLTCEKTNSGSSMSFASDTKTLSQDLEFYSRIGALIDCLAVHFNPELWGEANNWDTTRLLNSLGPSENAAYDSALSKRAPCAPGTGSYALRDLKDWAHSPVTDGVHWLNGMAGTGKTAISYSFCHELDQVGLYGASFFCSGSKHVDGCRSPQRVLPTIAFQLANYSNIYRGALMRILSTSNRIVEWSIKEQFTNLLVQPLQHVGPTLLASGKAIVVVDGLDECHEDRAIGDLLATLLGMQRALPIRFLISSRPEPVIYRLLTNGRNHDQQLTLHELDASITEIDIQIYLEHELRGIPLVHHHWANLSKECSRWFLYASMTAQSIKDKHQNHNNDKPVITNLDSIVKTALQKAKSSSIRLLSSILDEASKFVSLQGEVEPTTWFYLLRLLVDLGTIPPTLELLADLLGLSNAQAAEHTLQNLRSVLHIDKKSGCLKMIHPSFLGSIAGRDQIGEIQFDSATYHGVLTDRCLAVIRNHKTQFNICRLQSSYVLDSEVSDLKSRAKLISGTLFYASCNWATHLLHGDAQPVIVDQLHDFLAARLLFWMEVLNLKKHMESGPEILRRITFWCKAKNLPEQILDLVDDACQFVSVYASHLVSRSTPHIYISMLSFWLPQRPISKLYQPRTTGLPELRQETPPGQRFVALGRWPLGQNIASTSFSTSTGLVSVIVQDPYTFYVLDPWTGQSPLSPQIMGEESIKINVFAISVDGLHIAGATADNIIHLWETRPEFAATFRLKGHTSTITSITFSLDGSLLATGSEGGAMYIWSTQAEEPLSCLSVEGSRHHIHCIAFSENGEFIASGLTNGSTRIYETRNRSLLYTIRARTRHPQHSAVTSLAFSYDGTIVATGFDNGMLQVSSTRTGQVVRELRAHLYSVLSLAFASDGMYLASGSLDKTARVWSMRNGETVVGPLEGHHSGVQSVHFSQDDFQLITSSNDGTIQLWPLDSKDEVPEIQNTEDYSDITLVRYSPDGHQVLSASRKGSLFLQSTLTGDFEKMDRPLGGHNNIITSIDISPNGAYIVSCSNDKMIRIWDAHTGKDIHGGIEGHTDWVNSVRFSPDGLSVVSGSDDLTVRMWDVRQGVPKGHIMSGHDYWVSSAGFSPDGTRVVSGSRDSTIRVWDVESGEQVLGPFPGGPSAIRAVEFSPNGRCVASGSAVGALQVWDVAVDGNSHPHWIAQGHSGCVFCIAFSPDSKFIVSGSLDQTIRVWDTRTGDLLLSPLQGHDRWVYSLHISPSGSKVVSTCGTVRYWALPSYEKMIKSRGKETIGALRPGQKE